MTNFFHSAVACQLTSLPFLSDVEYHCIVTSYGNETWLHCVRHLHWRHIYRADANYGSPTQFLLWLVIRVLFEYNHHCKHYFLTFIKQEPIFQFYPLFYCCNCDSCKSFYRKKFTLGYEVLNTQSSNNFCFVS